METDYLYELEPLMWDEESFNRLLMWAVEKNASDIRVESGDFIWVRTNGRWRKVTQRTVEVNEVKTLIETISGDASSSSRVMGGKEFNFAHEVRFERMKKKRFRGNATGVKRLSGNGISIIFRVIPEIPPKLETLGLEPPLLEGLFPEKGLVLITGVMGSGKTTLLAAGLRDIIEKGGRYVQTYEDPIEFDLTSIPGATGPVSQTSIPDHLASFLEAPKNAARRAVDVALIGESKERETIHKMIEMSELGLVAYSTVHTRSVHETPSRIINIFDTNDRPAVATTLIEVIRLIVQQRLVERCDRPGRVALREYLVITEEIRAQLRGLDFKDFAPVLKELTRSHGQNLLQDAIKKFNEGIIEEKVVLSLKKEFGDFH